MVDVHVFPTEATPGGVAGQLRPLLDAAFPGEFSDEDWDHALGGWHAAVTDGEELVAHAAVVPRTIEVAGRTFRCGYVEAVATAPHRQGEGHGTSAMAALDAVIRAEFEMGALSTGSHGFYERLGWEPWRGPTFVRRDGRAVRTAEDDDGVMVLRFGPSADIGLDGSIVCEWRPGDVW